MIPGVLGFIWLIAWRWLYYPPEQHPRINESERQMILADRSESEHPGGVRPQWKNLEAEMNPLFFAPHIRPPKLMLNGLYDDNTPERTSVEPFFRLLKEPKKRASFAGGHLPLPEIAVPLVNAWMDETLGRVPSK